MQATYCLALWVECTEVVVAAELLSLVVGKASSAGVAASSDLGSTADTDLAGSIVE